jgi:predicted lipoprotein with Yx(FWY)xxD motif
LTVRRLLSIAAVALAAVALAPGGALGGARARVLEVYVDKSQFGPILFAGNGRALYAFTRDARRRSACSGACAAAWPPALVGGDVRARSGARPSLLGTLVRTGGARQLTYGGRPLYYYVGDRSPGQVLCQNVREYGGLWLVVRGDGSLVR